MRGPRSPVLAPHLVEDRAAYAYSRVCLKACTVARVVLSTGLEQPDHPGLDQVLDLHGRRQSPQHVVGDAPDEVHVALDQQLALLRRFTRVHGSRVRPRAQPPATLRSRKNAGRHGTSTGTSPLSARRANSLNARPAGLPG